MAFSEKPVEGDGVINGGFFVFNRKMFDFLTEDEHCDFKVDPLEKIAAEIRWMDYQNTFWCECHLGISEEMTAFMPSMTEGFCHAVA